MHISLIAYRCLRLPGTGSQQQLYGDVRTIPAEMMRGCDACFTRGHFEDPMGNQFEAVTFDINQNTTISLAKAAPKPRQEFCVRPELQHLRDRQGSSRKETGPAHPITAMPNRKRRRA